jgi:bifunctional DNA-binding transcriptional regulator/antitoxin component of YhaV-PrlF toxin-antitoxin module
MISNFGVFWRQAVPAVKIKILEGGRLIVPAPFRKQLGLIKGDTVLCSIQGGKLTVEKRSAAIAEVQAMMARFVPVGVSLADELVAERREESLHDQTRGS